MAKVTLKVPKRNGFDKSHQMFLTSKCGTLTPILCDELIPNTKVHLEDVISACLPPLASDTFMKCNLKVEAFFVPTRLLYAGYENWLTGAKMRSTVSNTVYNFDPYIPLLNITSATSSYVAPGKLADYLGLRTMSGLSTNNYFNIFPFLAYHKVYDDWYRNTQVQAPVFEPIMVNEDTGAMVIKMPVYNIPYNVIAEHQAGTTVTTYLLSDKLADGVALGDLRQRNFGFDYFTCALPNPQLGSAKSVSFTVSNNAGSISIASIRAANSLQQFAERNNIAGVGRMQDYVKANYGANLSTGVAQRAILLGSGEIPVYSKGVYQTSNFDTTSAGTSIQNPFKDSVGAEFGSASCNGKLNLVSDFVAEEPGYLMVLASLVPVVTYSGGCERMLLRYNTQGSQTDMANPILQNVGNQPIYQQELNGNFSYALTPFGYVDRYADYKYCNDRIAGLLRDGQSLQSFALQRTFSGTPTVSDTFLQIPTNYLDQVAAVSGSISSYGVWINAFHSYKISQPLAAYSIPSLQDPAYEHGDDVDVTVGGTRL